MISVLENGSLCLACIMDQNVWLIIMDSFVTNCIAGMVYWSWLGAYSSVMKSRIINACMCKTTTDLCIRSARVQCFHY